MDSLTVRPAGSEADHLRAFAEPGKDVAHIQRVDQPVAILVRGVAVGIARTDWAAESAEHETGVERVDQPVAVGVALAGEAVEELPLGTLSTNGGDLETFRGHHHQSRLFRL